MLKIFGDCFYFSRHGETDNNALGLVTGAKDVQLSKDGVKQAQDIAPLIAKLKISSCVCSPLIRSSHTATLMLSKTNVVPVPVNGMEERHWGELECTPKTELDRYSFTEMGVEPWDEFIKRNIDAISPLDVERPALIVAHSGTFRAFCDFLQVRIEKRPVLNVWPYKFYKIGVRWFVEAVDF